MPQRSHPDPEVQIPTPEQLKELWFPSSNTYLTRGAAEDNFIPSLTRQLNTKEILEIFVKTAATIGGKPYAATYVCSTHGELVRGPSRYSFVPVQDDNTGAVHMIDDLGNRILQPIEEKILQNHSNVIKPFHDHTEFMAWLGVNEKPDFIQRGQVLLGTTAFSRVSITPNNLMFVTVMSGGSAIAGREILLLERLMQNAAAQFEKAIQLNCRLRISDTDLE